MKATLVLLVALALVCCKEEDSSIDTGFQVTVGIFRGMAKDDQAKCAAALTAGKDTIYQIIENAIAEIEAGKDIVTVIGNAVVKFIAIPNVMTECNILQFPALIKRLATKEGLKEVFQTCVERIDDIWNYGQQIIPAAKGKEYDNLGTAIGHILAIALKFNVN